MQLPVEWGAPSRSPLTKGRGLKLANVAVLFVHLIVAPHEGAWIEIPSKTRDMIYERVAPHEGAWIEIASQALAVIVP